ncbi:MAG: hypothetical protein H0X30_00965 [Anaerolineae bacterium]|nr:hypothetical protein [Anaerolineae bacterium]
MATDLTALFDHWNTLAQDAAERINATPHPSMGGFYTGVMYGMMSWPQRWHRR